MQPPMQDIEFIRSIFDYDPDSGKLTWRKRNDVPAWWNTRYAGLEPTATDSLGYCRAKITYKGWSGYVSSHRICFMLHYGWLPDVVDHINGNVQDNKASNLRASDEARNAWNRKANSGTITGMKGVHVIRYSNGPNKGGICGYCAKIGHNGAREYLGFFKDASSAAAAYKARETELREEYRRK